MIGNSIATTRRRLGAVAMALGIHGALAVAVMLAFAVAAPDREIETIAAFDAPVPGPARPDPRPRAEPVVEPQPERDVVVPVPRIWLPTDNPTVVAMLAEAEGAGGGGCDLTAPVEAALRANPDLARELAGVPAARLSVARALAVWNQEWTQPDMRLPAAVMDTIRRTTAATIAAAPAACREQPQAGPRLVYLPVGDATAVLAMGSGDWRWQDLATSAVPNFRLAADDSVGTAKAASGTKSGGRNFERRGFVLSDFGAFRSAERPDGAVF